MSNECENINEKTAHVYETIYEYESFGDSEQEYKCVKCGTILHREYLIGANGGRFMEREYDE